MKIKNNRIILKFSFGFWGYFFGLVPLLLGSFFLLGGIILVGALLLCIGLFFSGFIQKTIVDANTNLVIKKWGLFIPVAFKPPVQLTGARAVIIYQMHAGKRSFRTSIGYDIAIQFDDKEVVIWNEPDSDEVHKIAQGIGELLKVRHYFGSPKYDR